MLFRRKFAEYAHWTSSRLKPRGGVLLYHRVAEDSVDPFQLCVSREHFEEQMSVLAGSGRAASVENLMNRGESERGIAVTFDDGYLDVFENALPILEKYEIPATVFVTTGNLGDVFWWDRLARVVHGGFISRDPSKLKTENGFPEIEPAVLNQPSKLYDKLYGILQQSNASSRTAMLDSLDDEFPSREDQTAARAASPDQVRAASDHPLVTIGAHTVSHSRLASLSTECQFNEIKQSLEELSKITGKPITTFSYPFGLWQRDFNDATTRVANEAGVSAAFAANRGVITETTNPLRIPRLWVHDNSADVFRRKLEFWTGSLN